jgi:hypothetical protein
VLLIILGIFWVAILVPVAVRRFRDSGTERSIHSFHAEHEVLSRQEYAVAPAHRLDPPDQDEVPPSRSQRPRLTVVHEDDTFRSLEARNSWDEWADDYDFEREEERSRSSEPVNRYVSAYSSVPNEIEMAKGFSASRRLGSMRARRQTFFIALLAAAVLLSGVGFAMGYTLAEDFAVLGWMAVLCYVSLALFAVSQGYLYESSLPIRIPQGRRVATLEPIKVDQYEDDDEEFFDPVALGDWRRDAHTHYAVG